MSQTEETWEKHILTGQDTHTKSVCSVDSLEVFISVYKSLAPQHCVLSIVMHHRPKSKSNICGNICTADKNRILYFWIGCASETHGLRAQLSSWNRCNNQVSHLPSIKAKVFTGDRGVWRELDRSNFNQVDFGLRWSVMEWPRCSTLADSLCPRLSSCLCCVCLRGSKTHTAYLSGSWHVSESTASWDQMLTGPSLGLHFIGGDNLSHIISCQRLLVWAVWLTLITALSPLLSATSITAHSLESASIIVCLPFTCLPQTLTLSHWPCFTHLRCVLVTVLHGCAQKG